MQMREENTADNEQCLRAEIWQECRAPIWYVCICEIDFFFFQKKKIERMDKFAILARDDMGNLRDSCLLHKTKRFVHRPPDFFFLHATMATWKSDTPTYIYLVLFASCVLGHDSRESKKGVGQTKTAGTWMHDREVVQATYIRQHTYVKAVIMWKTTLQRAKTKQDDEPQHCKTSYPCFFPAPLESAQKNSAKAAADSVYK